MKNSQFKVGDQVEWASTSNGSKKTKRGTVEAVIGAGKYPSDAQCKEVGTSGLARDHESFMVRVPGKTSASKGKLYWPRVFALKQQATEAANEIERDVAVIRDFLSIACQSTSVETRRDFFNCAHRHGVVEVVDENGDYKVNGVVYKLIC